MNGVREIGWAANLALFAACFAASVVLHYPGQLTFDAITVWFESRQIALFSQHPPAQALLWHYLEFFVRGPGGFCVLQLGALWLAAWLLVARARPPLLWAALCYAGLFVCPSVFALSSQLGKDELGAHLSVLAALAVLPVGAAPSRPTATAAGFGLSAFAALLRYQFAIVTLVLLATLWWRDRALTRAAAALGAVLATVVLVNLAISATFVRPAGGDVEISVRKILVYDIAGALALDPGAGAPVLATRGVDVAVLKQRAALLYTPTRADPLWDAGGLFALLDAVPDAAIVEQWRDSVVHAPLAFLRHRRLAFARVIGIGNVYDCWPVAAGISSIPPDRAAAVGAEGYAPSLSAAVLTSRYFPAGTLLFRGWVYGAVSLLLLVGWRAGRVPFAAAALAGSGLLYELTFAALPQACDVRYSYFLMLSALFSTAIAVFRAVSLRRL